MTPDNEKLLFQIHELVKTNPKDAYVLIQEKFASHFCSFDCRRFLSDDEDCYPLIKIIELFSVCMKPEHRIRFLEASKANQIFASYIINYQDIEQTLSTTKESTIRYIDYDKAFLWIRALLGIRIRQEVLYFLMREKGLKGKNDDWDIDRELTLAIRRLKRSKKTTRNSFDKVIIEIAKTFQVTPSELLASFHHNSYKVYLRRIYDEVIVDLHDQLSINARCRLLFPLYKLILPDKEFKTEEEFLNTSDDSMRFYDRYQKDKVYRITFGSYHPSYFTGESIDRI